MIAPPTFDAACVPHPNVVEEAAARLWNAAKTATPCSPVRDLIGDIELDQAYAVQQLVTAARVAAGAVVVGRKIGLTSAAVQAQLGVDCPDFGVLFDEMAYASGEVIPAGLLLQPKIEAEVAFVLAEDLAVGPLDLAQIRQSVAYAVAALEIVDSRIKGWDITLNDTVADNASSGLYVLGAEHVALDQINTVEIEMSMTVDGKVVSVGNGAACLGDPLAALMWLAVTARDRGDPLRAGQVVLSGALGPMHPVEPGAIVAADLSGLGRVTVMFDEHNDPDKRSLAWWEKK